MDKYLSIVKNNNSSSAGAHNTKKRKVLTEKERILEIATTPKLGGHDIWQSASTGHQVSEAGGKSVSYNDARLAKLKVQFAPPTESNQPAEPFELFQYTAKDNTYHPTRIAKQVQDNNGGALFSGCTFYLDGYLGATASDHTLRRLITKHGGLLSNYLKKTRITHVVLSDRGDLAGSKIRKEVEGSRNRVKFVKVGWIYRCIEEGRRIGEWRYAVDRLSGGNGCVASMFEQQDQNRTSIAAGSIPSSRAIQDEESRNMTSITAAGVEQNAATTAGTTDDVPKATLFETRDELGILDSEEGERLDALDR